MVGLFKREKKSNKNKFKWEIEYEDTVYKVYDWNESLAGYFFPGYSLKEPEERDPNEIADRLYKTHLCDHCIRRKP
jgi:hypothetical protein